MKSRKRICILAALVMAGSLMACGNGSDLGNGDGVENTQINNQDQSDAAETLGTETTDTDTADTTDIETTDTESIDTANTVNPETEQSDSEATDKLTFSAADLNGHPISSSDINGAKVIMVNFWEPWCGPCVGEMPDLQDLYEKYSEQGLMLLGVFYSTSSEDAAKAFVSDNQITYPILIGNDDFGPFTTEYVPTTVFFDGDGNLLSENPIVGAQSYEDWEKLIEEYLDSVEK